MTKMLAKTALLLLLPALLSAQKRFKSELSGGALAAFVRTDPALPKNWSGSNLGERISPIVSYRLAWLRGQRWQFLGGLQTVFYRMSYRCDCSQWPSEHDGNGGYLRDPELDDVVGTNYLFLEMPLSARFFTSKKGSGLFAEAGFTPGVSLRQIRRVFSPLLVGESNLLKGVALNISLGTSKKLRDGNQLVFSIGFKKYVNDFHPREFFTWPSSIYEPEIQLSALSAQIGFQF